MRNLSFIMRIIVLAAFTSQAVAQDPLSDFERNRALWDSHGFSYYSFIVSKSCFCFLPSEVRIIVADNAIYDIVDPVSGEPARMRDGEAVMPRFLDSYETIDELFDRIASELEAKGDALTGAPGWIPGIGAVLYDERYGFPTFVTIDHGRRLEADGSWMMITDSGTTYRLRGFLAVSPDD